MTKLNFRGRYFAERGSFWEGHFWGAPGQNFQFLVAQSATKDGKFQKILKFTKIVFVPKLNKENIREEVQIVGGEIHADRLTIWIDPLGRKI